MMVWPFGTDHATGAGTGRPRSGSTVVPGKEIPSASTGDAERGTPELGTGRPPRLASIAAEGSAADSNVAGQHPRRCGSWHTGGRDAATSPNSANRNYGQLFSDLSPLSEMVFFLKITLPPLEQMRNLLTRTQGVWISDRWLGLIRLEARRGPARSGTLIRPFTTIARPVQEGLAFRSKGRIRVASRRAPSANDPTAPSASTDPGLVLVRGPDRPDLQDERKGWIMSVKLTDAQFVMMSAAAQRKDRCMSAPTTIRGAALVKVSAKLAKLGLANEIEAKPGAPIWRRDDAGQGYALKLTAAGLKAIAVDEGSPDATEHSVAPQPQARNRASPDESGDPARPTAPRDGSKLALVIELLQLADGATIVDLTQATGWLPHTTRAALTGLRKRGYAVIRERIGTEDSVYRLSGAPADRGDCIVQQRDARDGGGPKQKAAQAA
jgi:hypothetical protein